MILQTRIGQLIKDLQKLNELNMWIKVMSERDINTFVVEKIRLRLQKGEMPDGTLITNQLTGDRFYKMITQLTYAEIGRRIEAGSHYTMKHTGEFYDSLKLLEPDADLVEIFGEKKDVNLFEKYGNDLIDLTDENIQELIQKVKEKYLQNIRQLLRIG